MRTLHIAPSEEAGGLFMRVFVAVCKAGDVGAYPREELFNTPLVWALSTLPVAIVIGFEGVF